MEIEIRYKANWEIWPAIRDRLPERVRWLVLEDESWKEVKVEEVKAGGRYHVKESKSQKPKPIERTMKFKWQDTEIEVKFEGISRLWRAIREATNYMGRVEIVDEEGKRVDVARWDISKKYTAQPERGSYKPKEIETMLQWSKMPKRENPQRREPEPPTDRRKEEWAPRIVASMWKRTIYESELTWALTKSQISHTHPEWQAWKERNETRQIWLHLEDDEVQEEVTLGRMAEEIERAAEKPWGPTKCTNVRDDHFHFESVERKGRTQEYRPVITKEEARAEQMQAIEGHLEWMRSREKLREEGQVNPWVWSAEDSPAPEQAQKQQ
jgi:hypothetical protein